jgi:hypothetical protein
MSDSNAVIACFAEDAVVHDEGQEMRGLSAISKPVSLLLHPRG